MQLASDREGERGTSCSSRLCSAHPTNEKAKWEKQLHEPLQWDRDRDLPAPSQCAHQIQPAPMLGVSQHPEPSRAPFWCQKSEKNPCEMKEAPPAPLPCLRLLAIASGNCN